MNGNVVEANISRLARETRKDILVQIQEAGSGHPGGSMSCADILAAVFGYAVKPTEDWLSREDRDRVILSKGHAAPALYGILAEVGLLPKEELLTLRKLGSRLQGHPDFSRFPEVGMSTGSLGQGLSVGVGLAWLYKQRKSSGRVYVIVGDGELDSGQIWEAIALAGILGLANLVMILDANGIQNDGFVKDIYDLIPYQPKLEAFQWAVKDVDGHCIPELIGVLDWAMSEEAGDKPRCILARTVKGKGVSFMENNPSWHSHSLSPDEFKNAMKEIEAL